MSEKRKVCVYSEFGELLHVRESISEASKKDAGGTNVGPYCRSRVPVGGINKLFVFEDEKQPLPLHVINIFFRRRFGFTIHDKRLRYKNVNYSCTELAHMLGTSTTKVYKEILGENKRNIMPECDFDYKNLKHFGTNGKVYYYCDYEPGDELLTEEKYLKKYYHVTKDSLVYHKSDNRIIEQKGKENGYLFAYVFIPNGKSIHTKMYPVHRLVAMWYLPDYYDFPVVNHIDGNKQNNNVTNLEMCTQGWNHWHAIHVLKGGQSMEEAKKEYEKNQNYFAEEIIKRLKNGFGIEITDSDKIVANVEGNILKSETKWQIGKYKGVQFISQMAFCDRLAIRDDFVYPASLVPKDEAKDFVWEEKVVVDNDEKRKQLIERLNEIRPTLEKKMLKELSDVNKLHIVYDSCNTLKNFTVDISNYLPEFCKQTVAV